MDTYIRAFDRREPFVMEYRLRRHDGEYRWLLDNAAPLFDPDGSFAGYIGTCFDVTESRRAEAERNVANDRLRLAMESGKSVGWERDLKTNRETWFGDLSTIFGIPSNIYVGPVEDSRHWVHPEDQDLVEKAVEDALESRSPRGRIPRRVAQRHGAMGGSQGPVPLTRWQTERMLGMIVDITERKDAEESLVRKEVELKEAQRLAGVGSWHWIQRPTRSYGRRNSIASPAAIRACRPSHTKNTHSSIRARAGTACGARETALHTGAPYELVLEMIRADGAHRWIRARGEIHRDSAGNIARLRGTVQDITERKLAEEACPDERPSHRSPGVRAREDRQRPARRHRSAPRVAGDGAGPGERPAAGSLGWRGPRPPRRASETDHGDHL